MTDIDEVRQAFFTRWGDISPNDPKYQKALDFKMTVISFEEGSPLTAIMPSSRKRHTYLTTLLECSCDSFLADQTPCKHMIRLAMELGIIDAPFQSYTQTPQGYTWKEVIDIVDQLPLDLQSEFLSHFKLTKSKKQPYRKKKEQALDDLIQNKLLIEYPEKETPKFKTVIMPWDFFRDARKVHWYYARKLYSYTEDDVDGITIFEASVIPNDEVTQYLLSRGYLKGCHIED